MKNKRIVTEKSLANLDPATKNTARIRGRNGALKANETKRINKTFKEIFTSLLNESIPENTSEQLGGLKAKIKEMFPHLKNDDITYKLALLLPIWKKIMSGDIGSERSFEILRDTIGEKPVERTEISGALDLTIVDDVPATKRK